MTALNPVYTIGWQIVEAILAHQDISEGGRAGPRRRAAGQGRHPQSGGADRQLPARVLRRHAPAGRHRHRHGQRPRGDSGRRAHHRPRRDRAGAGAELAQDGHDGDRGRAAPDHPRPRGHRRPGRPRPGDVRRAAVEIGTAEDVFYRPSMPYTLGLLGSLPRLDGDGSERLRQIPGSPPSMLGDRTGCPFAPAAPSPPTSAARPSPSSWSCLR